MPSNTLLLADVSENFKTMCLETYELDPAKFLSASRLAWQASLKNVKVKLRILTDINIIKSRKRYYKRNMSLYLSICNS